MSYLTDRAVGIIASRLKQYIDSKSGTAGSPVTLNVIQFASFSSSSSSSLPLASFDASQPHTIVCAELSLANGKKKQVFAVKNGSGQLVNAYNLLDDYNDYSASQMDPTMRSDRLFVGPHADGSAGLDLYVARDGKLTSVAGLTEQDVAAMITEGTLVTDWQYLTAINENCFEFIGNGEEFYFGFLEDDNESQAYRIENLDADQARVILQRQPGNVLGFDPFGRYIRINVPPVGQSSKWTFIYSLDATVISPQLETCVLSGPSREVIVENSQINFEGCDNLKAVIGKIRAVPVGVKTQDGVTTGNALHFNDCPKLEYFRMELLDDFDIHGCPELTVGTVKYLIESAPGTKEITLTLAPEVMAKINDTTNTQWHALAAKAAAKNVLLEEQ